METRVGAACCTVLPSADQKAVSTGAAAAQTAQSVAPAAQNAVPVAAVGQAAVSVAVAEEDH